MNQKKKIVIFIIIIIGIIVPFVPYLTLIQMWFLLIPYSIVFGTSLIYLIISLLDKNLNVKKALFAFFILPIFILSQLISCFTVDKIQRLRSNRIISEIKKLESETGSLPEEYEVVGGIEYYKINGEENFVIQY